jgi:hypothetical protein
MENIARTNGTSPAAILSMIGGALMLAGGIIMLSIWSWIGAPGWGPMMGGYGGMMTAMRGAGYFGWMAGTVSALSLATGAVVIVGGYFIYRKPESSTAWGAGILVASIIGLFGMGGFIVGPVFGIVGGIMALAKR